MYLVATSSSLQHHCSNIGVLVGPRVTGLRPLREGRWWAADNDAYHGRFNAEVFLRHLERLRPYRHTCLWVAAPDVREDAPATYHAFLHWQPILERYAFPIAYVCQDGSQHFPFPAGAHSIFIGGSDQWRSQHAASVIRRARTAGLGVHVGRVNSRRRVADLAALGVDSVDGTFLSYRGVARGLGDITGWLQTTRAQLSLEETSTNARDRPRSP